MKGFRQMSLLGKLWLSTSVALTALFLITGWVVQRNAVETTSRSLEEEVRASFQAYESLWKSRSKMLRSVAAIISSMPNVRAAFGTGDPATIRDTTAEVWAKLSDDLKEAAVFLVTDPEGHLVASLGDMPEASLPEAWPVVAAARHKFPDQVSGFYVHHNRLFQVVLTPVYVDSVSGPALINVLVAGFEVNALVAQRLKESTGGSDYLFLSQGRVFASTLNPRATAVLAREVTGTASAGRVSDGVFEYSPLIRELVDLEGTPIGKVCIFRSFEGARQRIAGLRRAVILVWLLAISAGLPLTYLLARKIVQPVKMLDRAASEVSRQNYSYRVKVDRGDELGRLAATFNSMCMSIENARAELIRQERISTIGRLASSIVHDLRNPLAAIYGGAEILVDMDLPPAQMKRLAGNIYHASRRIQALLQDLVNVTRGKIERPEPTRLSDVILGAREDLQATADAQAVSIVVDVPEEIELPLERHRIERVFLNLISNALEAMPGGGTIRITARMEEGAALIKVEDTGPGISPDIRAQLFQPFVSFGKKGGLGLGLALSRQTVLDHGGDMWVDTAPGEGARFFVRLPAAVPQGKTAPASAGLPAA